MGLVLQANLLLVILTLATGRILRRNCGDFADFSHVRNNNALEGHVLSVFTGLLPAECQEECINHVRCKSINVELNGNKTCELNSRTEADATDRVTVVARSGWKFMSTSYKDPLIGHLCRRKNPCGGNRLCLDVCFAPGYVCHDCHELSTGAACRRGPRFKNIARGKKTAATSNYYSDQGGSWNIVDGFYGMSYNYKFRCLMLHEPGWLSIEFGVIAEVHKVAIHGRTDGHHDDRQKALTMLLGNENDPSASNIYTSDTFALSKHGHIKTFGFKPPLFVLFLFVKSNNYYLTICEIVVDGFLSM